MKQSALQRKTPLVAKTPLKRSPMKRSGPKKSTYTKSLRQYIYERDGGKCIVCGRFLEEKEGECHHVIPRGRFFSQWYTFEDVNDERNLALLCWICHNHDDPAFVDRVIAIQEKRFGKLRKDFG